MASDAQKRASTKWNASKDNITIRPTKEIGAAIRAAAAVAGQSNQQYLIQAARERMERDNGVQSHEGVNSTIIDYGLVLPHIQKTGETIREFVTRSVKTTVESDERMLKFGISPVGSDDA